VAAVFESSPVVLFAGSSGLGSRGLAGQAKVDEFDVKGAVKGSHNIARLNVAVDDLADFEASIDSDLDSRPLPWMKERASSWARNKTVYRSTAQLTICNAITVHV
jgi:hypothetical protein